MTHPPQSPGQPDPAPTAGEDAAEPVPYSVPPAPTAQLPAYGGGYEQPAGQPAPAAYGQGFGLVGPDPAAIYGQPTPPGPALSGPVPPAWNQSAGSAPPASAPPGFAPPASAPPGWNPPASAPPGVFAPGSAPPAAGWPPGGGGVAPMSAMPDPAGGPVGRSAPMVLILAIAAGLLFVLGGVMTGLFVSTNNELGDTRKDLTAQVAERDDTIATKDQEMERLRGDLERAQSDLATANQSLTGTRNDRDKVAQEKQVIAQCLTLFSRSMDAAVNGDRATVDRLSAELNRVCTEAEGYI